MREARYWSRLGCPVEGGVTCWAKAQQVRNTVVATKKREQAFTNSPLVLSSCGARIVHYGSTRAGGDNQPQSNDFRNRERVEADPRPGLVFLSPDVSPPEARLHQGSIWPVHFLCRMPQYFIHFKTS